MGEHVHYLTCERITVKDRPRTLTFGPCGRRPPLPRYSQLTHARAQRLLLRGERMLERSTLRTPQSELVLSIHAALTDRGCIVARRGKDGTCPPALAAFALVAVGTAKPRADGGGCGICRELLGGSTQPISLSFAPSRPLPVPASLRTFTCPLHANTGAHTSGSLSGIGGPPP